MKRPFLLFLPFLLFIAGAFVACEEVEEAGWNLEASTFDLHHNEEMVQGNVMTEYEEKFSSMGNPICKMVISREYHR